MIKYNLYVQNGHSYSQYTQYEAHSRFLPYGDAMKIPLEPAFTILNALADKTRLQIIEFLQDGEKVQGEIMGFIGKKQSTTSQHLKVLLEGGLVTYRLDTKQKYYKIKDSHVFGILVAVSKLISSQNDDKIDGITSQNIKDTLL